MQKNLLRRIEEIAIDLKRVLERRNIKVKEIYLFGSYARGDHLKTSDVDLIVVSDDWNKTPFLKRLDLVNEVMWVENIAGVEVIPVTSKELEEKRSVVLRDASRYWIRIV